MKDFVEQKKIESVITIPSRYFIRLSIKSFLTHKLSGEDPRYSAAIIMFLVVRVPEF